MPGRPQSQKTWLIRRRIYQSRVHLPVRFQQVPSKLFEAQAQGAISPMAVAVLREFHETLVDRAARVGVPPPTRAADAVARAAVDLTAAAEALVAGNANRPTEVFGLLQECAAAMLGPSVEVVLVPATGASPRVYPLPELAPQIILLFDGSPSVLDERLRALLVHEVAHADQIVGGKCRSPNWRRRKTGEVLADTAAMALTGGALTAALRRYAELAPKFSGAGPAHPSLNIRAACLVDHCGRLWPGSYGQEVADHIRDLADVADPGEDGGILGDCLSEAVTFTSATQNFKLSESEVYGIREGIVERRSPRASLAADTEGRT